LRQTSSLRAVTLAKYSCQSAGTLVDLLEAMASPSRRRRTP
jgi:hypothetical protein